jgi:hypothetical protein
MATVNIKFDFKAATNDLLRKFNKVKRNKQMNTEIGTFVTKRIQAEARRGKPINAQRKFPKLKSLTVAQRSRLAKLNRTTSVFSPGRSNLSFTGQLIDALMFKVKKDKIIVEVEDSRRRPYKTGADSIAKSTPSNKDLDKILRSIGFRMFTAQGIKREPKITKRVKSIVLRTLRRALKVSS